MDLRRRSFGREIPRRYDLLPSQKQCAKHAILPFSVRNTISIQQSWPVRTHECDIDTSVVRINAVGWHTDTTGAGSWLQFDLGMAAPITGLNVYAWNAGSCASYTVQYSYDTTAWSDAQIGFMPSVIGWNNTTWRNAGDHLILAASTGEHAGRGILDHRSAARTLSDPLPEFRIKASISRLTHASSQARVVAGRRGQSSLRSKP